MKTIYLIILLTNLLNTAFSQTDTVEIQLSKTGKIVFTLEDKAELDQLEHYNFQTLFEDIISRMREENFPGDDDESEESGMHADDDEEEDDEDDEEEWDDEEDEDEEEEEWDDEEDGDEDEVEEEWNDEDDDEDENEDNEMDDDDEEDGKNDYFKSRKHRHFMGMTNLDLGIGNYLSGSDFPDEQGAQYAVRPWGSWYVGLTTSIHTRVNESFHIEWGAGVSAFNFKFQDDRTQLIRDSVGVHFVQDTRDLEYCKSKLTVGYLNLSILPMVEFGKYRSSERRWKTYERMFRVGAGVYGSYKLRSYTKQVYFDDNDRDKERNFDSFFLKNIRYGLRLQFGIHDTDFFFNYDLSPLFVEDRGPKLNAYSFGIVF